MKLEWRDGCCSLPKLFVFSYLQNLIQLSAGSGFYLFPRDSRFLVERHAPPRAVLRIHLPFAEAAGTAKGPAWGKRRASGGSDHRPLHPDDRAVPPPAPGARRRGAGGCPHGAPFASQPPVQPRELPAALESAHIEYRHIPGLGGLGTRSTIQSTEDGGTSASAVSPITCRPARSKRASRSCWA